MKLNRILLLLAGLLNFASAQPTLTTAQLPQNGDIFLRHYLDPQSISVGPSGANVTWDYSQATATSEVDSGVYAYAIPPMPGNWNYNQAYSFTKSLNGNPMSHEYFEYFINTQDSFSRAGENYGYADFHPIQFFNPAPLHRFPVNYGDNYTEAFSGRNQSFAGPQDFTGISYVHADAYGTLILPDTTWTNVLRIHVLDTAIYSGNPVRFNSCHYFYHAGERYPLMVHCEQGPSSFAHAWIGEQAGVLSGVREEAVSGVGVHPNPARERIRVELAGTGGPADLRIVDIRGRTVLRRKMSGSGSVSLGELQPGVYYVEIITAGGGRFVQKQLILE